MQEKVTDEYEKFIEKHIDTCSVDDKNTVDEFEKWLTEFLNYEKYGGVSLVLEKYRAFKAKDKAVEPLEKLAERKNKSVSVCVTILDSDLFQDEFDSEQAAREWLNKQEDK